MLLKISTIVFLIVLFIIYHLVPGKFRGMILLPASILFVYAEGGIMGLAVLAFITLCAYVAGLVIGRKRSGSRLVMILAVAVFVGILACWKYIPWLLV